MEPLALKNQTCLPSVTGVGDVESLKKYAGMLVRLPGSVTLQRILPLRASRQWPTISLPLGRLSSSGFSVVTNARSPQTAMPPCPSSGSVVCQTMCSSRATLQRVGTWAALDGPGSVRAPPACGQ